MLKALGSHRATLPIAIALIVLGLALILTAGARAIINYFQFQDSGVRITVPASQVLLQLDPDTPCVLAHRVTGSHVTTNRPQIELPDDITIELIDTETNLPIEFQRVTGYYQTYIFGFNSRRDGVAVFTAPPSGGVMLTVAGFEPETIFSVGPAQEVFDREVLPIYIAWLVASVAVLFLGVTLIIARLANPSLSITSDYAHS